MLPLRNVATVFALVVAFTFALILTHSSFAGQEFQTYELDWQFGDPGSAEITFDPFDTMDGARSLTSVTVEFNGQMAFEFAALNFDPVTYSENEWSMDAFLSVLFSFKETPDFPNGGPFFFLAGSQFIGLTGDLSPGFGGPLGPVREPGDMIAIGQASDTVESSLTVDGDLTYFQSDEPLQATLGPFTEFLLHPPGPAAFIDANLIALTQSGDLTMTYDFDVLCDIDGDDKCDINDIDIVIDDIVMNQERDLNGDGVTDLGDRDHWLTTAARVNRREMPYLLGDANLDGSVDAADLNSVGLHWLDDTSRWREGDFNASGVVDSADLNVLALNWQQSRIAQAPAAAQPVPEPSTGILLLPVLWAICRMAKQR